jgi:hypothetical protein
MIGLAAWLWDVARPSLLAAGQPSAPAFDSLGKWVFAAALALLLVWLIFMPRRLIGQAGGVPWWRNVRVWAIVVCAIQLAIYVLFA